MYAEQKFVGYGQNMQCERMMNPDDIDIAENRVSKC